MERKDKKKCLFALRLVDGMSYSMLCRNDNLLKALEEARASGEEDRIYNSVLHIVEKVLLFNDVFFDEVELV